MMARCCSYWQNLEETNNVGALLSSAVKGGNVSEREGKESCQMDRVETDKGDHPISVSEQSIVPTCELQTNNEITSVRW
jgi:hypothetical protein